MSQPSVAAFFSNRKRAAVDDVTTIKNRRLVEPTDASPSPSQFSNESMPVGTQSAAPSSTQQDDDIAMLKAVAAGMRTRSGRTVKRIGLQQQIEIGAELFPIKGNGGSSKLEDNIKQKKLVQFIKKGPLSPRKKPPVAPQDDDNANTANKLNNAFASKNNATNVQRGMHTPTKQIIRNTTPIAGAELKSMVKKELSFDEVKTKVSRSAKLQELKASLNRIQELEKTRKAQEERNRRLREAGPSPAKQKAPVVQLKEFDTIELEVLTSPSKTFKTPTKLPPPTPDKNELMSPRHTDVSKRLLFSPAKQGSPVKMIVPPAYQRFMSLAETSKAGQLPLPYKYRNLIEIFKGLDSVCAMFHNRKERITFKKLKPAVQRMLRKNFSETHLAQIKHIYPEAFIFTQMKMRNYGSTSKADYFQLVVNPNVEQLPEKKMQKIDEDDILSSAQSCAMNPHVMTKRSHRFQSLLLERVKDEHDKFLLTLDPPLSIPKHKVTRWHPDFDLESCPEVPRAQLPQPPNVEKYSSARDILSTARNLFNCATPMERAMERYEANLEADRADKDTETHANSGNVCKAETATTTTAADGIKPHEDVKLNLVNTITETTTAKPTVPPAAAAPPADDVTSNLLKGLPKSLLEKIRAKQAAKALDAMTRRPSQDLEATKYSRLPELARHLRNVFITERKGVLTQEIIIKKIQNSFRTSLNPQEIETHLKLIAKEVPAWVAFHEVRKTMYLKISKDMDMKKVIEQLENVANEKSK